MASKPSAHKVTVPVGSMLERHLSARQGIQPSTEIMLLANSMATILAMQGGMAAFAMGLGKEEDATAGRVAVQSEQIKGGIESSDAKGKVTGEQAPNREVVSFMDEALTFGATQTHQ